MSAPPVWRAPGGQLKQTFIPSSVLTQTALTSFPTRRLSILLPPTLAGHTYEPIEKLKEKGKKELSDRGVGRRAFFLCMYMCLHFAEFFLRERLIT